MDLWTPGIHRCAGFNASRPFRQGGKESDGKGVGRRLILIFSQHFGQSET